MRLRRKITNGIKAAMTTGAAYVLIGGGVARRNMTKDNAAKVASTTKHVAITTGKVAVHTVKTMKECTTNARAAIKQRKDEILAQPSDTTTADDHTRIAPTDPQPNDSEAGPQSHQ